MKNYFTIFKTLSIVILFQIIIPNSICAKWDTTITDHFKIVYQNDPTSSEYADSTYVSNVVTILDQIWDYLIVNQGFFRPPALPSDPITDPNKKIQIVIINEPRDDDDKIIYGDCNVIGQNGLVPNIIRIDNDYQGNAYPKMKGLEALRITLIHEFFHAVQQKYASILAFMGTTFDWFWDGTSAWVEDENVVLLDKNMDTINSYIKDGYAQTFLQDPGKSLVNRIDNVEPYGTVIFWKYFTEKGYSIRKIFEEYDSGFHGSAKNSDMIKEIIDAMGSEDKLLNLYKDFSLACFMKTGEFGFQDDGASSLPPVTTNVELVDDYYIDNFNIATGEINAKARTLDNLGANYLEIKKPASLTEKTPIFLEFDGNTDTNWGSKVVKILNDNTENPVDIHLDATSKKGKVEYDNFNGTDISDIKEIILIASRLATSGSETYEYSCVISKPPYVKKVSIKQNADDKYIKEWIDGTTSRTLNTIIDNPLNGKYDAELIIEFDEVVQSITVNIGAISIPGALDSNNKWIGSIHKNQIISLGNGDFTISITGCDLALNNFSVDITLPLVSNMNPADGGYAGTIRPTLTAIVADSGSGIDLNYVYIVIDGYDDYYIRPGQITYNSVTGLISLSVPADLALGKHTWDVYCSDIAGNEEIKGYSFNIRLPKDYIIAIDVSAPVFQKDPFVLADYKREAMRLLSFLDISKVAGDNVSLQYFSNAGIGTALSGTDKHVYNREPCFQNSLGSTAEQALGRIDNLPADGPTYLTNYGSCGKTNCHSDTTVDNYNHPLPGRDPNPPSCMDMSFGCHQPIQNCIAVGLKQAYDQFKKNNDGNNGEVREKELFIFTNWYLAPIRLHASGINPPFLESWLKTKYHNTTDNLNIKVTGIDFTNYSITDWYSTRNNYYWNVSDLKDEIEKTGGKQHLLTPQTGAIPQGLWKKKLNRTWTSITEIGKEINSPEENVYEDIPISSTDKDLRIIVKSPPDVISKLLKPDGIEVNKLYDPNIKYNYTDNYGVYQISNPEAGKWQLASTGRGDLNIEVIGKSGTEIHVKVPERETTGKKINVQLSLTSDQSSISVSYVRFKMGLENIYLYDDGEHGDGQADDYVFFNTFNLGKREGEYEWSAELEGFDDAGNAFSRCESGAINIIGAPPKITYLSPEKVTVSESPEIQFNIFVTIQHNIPNIIS